ncbi:hypothetical protein ACPTII_32595, partial [Pseudomonas aeruginosa]|uniref:hypothetical protein n=1 Tax=Pseudomonas aeruginosa TaxID=287 RepID=UPI003CC50CD1
AAADPSGPRFGHGARQAGDRGNRSYGQDVRQANHLRAPPATLDGPATPAPRKNERKEEMKMLKRFIVKKNERGLLYS